MTISYSFSIIKPDATRRNITGKINSYIESAGLEIIAQRRIKMTKEIAEKFYEIHRERPFFNDLISFITSGPVIVQVLKGDDVVLRYRKIMGATNPVDADEGSIRKDFAESIEANSVHGSDSDENAKIEISQFFTEDQIIDN